MANPQPKLPLNTASKKVVRSRKPSLKEIIRRQVDNDPLTIADRAVMKARWGI